MNRQSRDPVILFDLDGPLLDTSDHRVISWSAFLRESGIVVLKWKIHRRMGMSGSVLRIPSGDPKLRGAIRCDS
jgi:phosphoglycolate phosphatase-like HAD superfamily hydrolase